MQTIEIGREKDEKIERKREREMSASKRGRE